MARVSFLPARCILLCIALLSLVDTATAQREYDTWHFGAGYILDFRSGTPTPTTGSWMWQDEGCAVWCDRRTGNTLFYTNGIDVYNRNNQLMPNGSGLYGHESAVQSALIVPVPCDTNRFYIFTADQMGYITTGPAPRGLNYSILDMRLQGGLGDITSKNVPLLNPASERITAVAHANGYDYWVIGHSRAANTFYAWRVTGAGISAPVVSVAGINQGPSAPLAAAFTLGALKASPNGRKLAMTAYSLNLVEIFDFDPSTGRVTNGIPVYQGPMFNIRTPVYGVTFSPDNTKLYLAALGVLQQYDVSLATPAAIIASGVTVASSDAPAANVSGFMQIGPDGKVYIVHDSLWIGVVNNPNLRGNACGYTSRRYQYPWLALFLHGLPNNIDAKATTVMSDSSAVRISPGGPLLICEGGSATFAADPGFVSYRWSTGATTRQITVTRAGTYSVTVVDSLGCTAQGAVELRVNPNPDPEIQGPRQFCQGDSVTLTVTQPFAQYLWSTGATTRQITVRQGGTYRVTVTDTNGCTGDTTFTVRMNPLPQPRITGDLEICDDERSVLDAGAGYAAYLWSTGQTTRMIDVRDPGLYWVAVTDSNGCRGGDTVDLVVHPLPDPHIIASKRRFCDGDSAVLTVSDTGVNAGATYRWSTGETGTRIVVRTGGRVRLDVMTMFGCTASDSMMIQVDPNPKPTITVDPSAILCEGDSAILDAGPGYAGYRWSTGETTRSIIVRVSGIYNVEVVDGNGCRGLSESVEITVHAIPDVTISGPGRVCPDRTATYSVVPEPGTSYTWGVSSGGTIISGQSTSMITVRWTSPGVERVTLRAVNSAGCSDSTHLAVVVNDDLHPTITPDRDPRLCEGDSVILTGDAGYAEYRWSTGETTRRIVVRDPGRYTLFVTDSLGCAGTSDPITVVVNPNPIPRVTPLGDVDLCEGDSVALDAGAYATYRWSTGDTTRRITVTKAGSYSVEVVDVNGCRGSSPSVDVTVTPLPMPSIDGPRLVCRYSVIDYSVRGTSGNSYQWRVTGGTIIGGQGRSTITVKWGAGGNGTVDVIETTPQGCAGRAETVTVIIGDVLQPVITANRPTTICDGDSVILDAGAGYDRYTWSTGETTQTIVVRHPGRYSVRVEENGGCAGSSAEIEVMLNPNPRPDIAGRLFKVCVGESVTLDAPEGYLSYRWSTGETSRIISVRSSGVYQVEVTDANGCVGMSMGDTVIVLPPPSKPVISALGDLLTSTPAAAYQWNHGGVEIPGATGRSYRALLPGGYTVTITDSNGCRATSDPARIPIARVAYLDTVRAHVGERVFLTMKIDPPLDVTDAMAGYTIQLKFDPKRLFVHDVVSPDQNLAGGEVAWLTRKRDGTIIVERPANARTLVGGELFRLTVEGLSTGLPANPVLIQNIAIRPIDIPGGKALQLSGDSVIISGHGLVLLTGCDIIHGFAVGKRAAITGVTPNPARTSMVVTWRAPQGLRPRLSLVDLTGRTVRWIELPEGTGSEQQQTFDLMETPSGAYMLELRHGGERMNVPVMVVR